MNDLRIAEHGLLKPAGAEPSPILRFRGWQVGDCVVSFGFGHGILVSFIDHATWFPVPPFRHYTYGSTQKVLAVVVDFAECGLVCLYPQSRNLRVYRGNDERTAVSGRR